MNKFSLKIINFQSLAFNELMKILVMLYKIGIHDIDLKNINLGNNFVEDDPDTIIFIRLLASHIKFEKCKALKKILVKS